MSFKNSSYIAKKGMYPMLVSLTVDKIRDHRALQSLAKHVSYVNYLKKLEKWQFVPQYQNS